MITLAPARGRREIAPAKEIVQEENEWANPRTETKWMLRHFAVWSALSQLERKGRDGQAMSTPITETEVAPEAIAAEASREVGEVSGEVVVDANGIGANS